ncbi:MAG: response regulator, partial [Bacteroidetes bacterium]|nr:response regulator [Bacteroidota bacterium]
SEKSLIENQLKMCNNYRILIADDNRTNLQVLGNLLRSENYETEFASNGKQALLWLDEEKFDLILLDVMMPEMSGFEVIAEIRKDPVKQNIPVIFLTAKTDTDNILKGLRLGAADYVTKPFNSEELLLRVKTQAEIKKSKDRIRQYSVQIENNLNSINESIGYAKKIQNALLPQKELLAEMFSDNFILNLPRNTVSGDFYWAKTIADNNSHRMTGSHPMTNKQLVFAVADSTGHGIPGAMMSMMGISLLNEIVGANNSLKANEILELLRIKIKKSLNQNDMPEPGSQEAYDTLRDGMDIALCIFDPETRDLQYSGANSPIFILRNKKLIKYNADRQPAGLHFTEKPFTNQIISLEKGDTIYLFSDGYCDQLGGPDEKKMLCKQFQHVLLDTYGLPLQKQHDALLEKFNRWKGGNDQTDDVMIMGVQAN